MKIKARQYALSLYESIKEKEGNIEAQKKIISEFALILKENNDITKKRKIINEFENIWNEKEGIVEAKLISASELDNDIVLLLKNYIKKITGAQEIIVKKRQDKSLLGGIILRYEDKVIDASLKTRVENLKNNMIK